MLKILFLFEISKLLLQVDPNSPADLGGLRNGDMILAVNGTSVKELKHQEVVALIKQNLKEASLLLVDEVSKTHLEEAGLPLYEQDKMIDYIDTIVVPESNNTSEWFFADLLLILAHSESLEIKYIFSF